MASSSSKDGQIRGEEAGGEKRNMPSSVSVEKLESADHRGCEGQSELGEVWGRVLQGAMARWFWFIGLCCSESDEPDDTDEIRRSNWCNRMSRIQWMAKKKGGYRYHSSRIQRMMEKEGEFSNDVESEIESSKVHWSEVDPAVSKVEHSAQANREYYEVLSRSKRYVCQKRSVHVVQRFIEPWHIFHDLPSKKLKRRVRKRRVVNEEIRRVHQMFIVDWGNVVVGEKLAEGGQAEIYAASVRGFDEPLVVKVFRAGCVLQELEKQFPPALMADGFCIPKCVILGATLLRDERLLGRFAFVMKRYWGDLRKLIDEQMMNSHNQGSPFPPHLVIDLMKQISDNMSSLHNRVPPILHNDLKSANILVEGTLRGGPCLDGSKGYYKVLVADYECSVGVLGTGIWRAPEILQQLKDRIPMTELVVTKKCDVYSFGMTCYELVSGHLPFEDYDFIEGRNRILNGERPELPHDLNPKIEDIVLRCWDPEPSKRPNFGFISNTLFNL